MNYLTQAVRKMLRISFFLVFAVIANAQSVTSLTLVNADTDQDIGQLQNNQTINLATIPTRNLNIRANTSPATIGSVKFGLDNNASYRIEGTAPYALEGDVSGNYNPLVFAVGTHTVTATPYSGSGAGGTAGTPLSISFSVVDNTPSGNGTGQVTVNGELKKWHKITLSIDGPASSEGNTDNPFLNYRLNVTFSKGTKTYTIPGYFAADGNAGETSASSGNVWKVHFAPDEVGTWNYAVSMRKGTNISVSDDAAAGTAVAPVDGKTGSIVVAASDKTGVDLRGKGRLNYVGGHHLQFAETGEYFLKAGADSPENFLAYEDFDNTPDVGGRRKTWAPHVQDWKSGDPTWKSGKGKGIIGAINYLSGQGMNVFSFLTMNINGDDRNVYPYTSSTDYTRFDVSKLDQWETVFSHGDKMGMYLHFKLQEIENNNLLDGGEVGTQRKLYYRELIARFAHHLALNWNVGEENTQTTLQRKQMAAYLVSHDPYKHHIVIHTWPGDQDAIYTPLLGSASEYTGVSIQIDRNSVYAETKKWVQNSAANNRKWVVANDEQGGANEGVAADAEYTGNKGTVADNSEEVRKEVLWGNLMAGGAGVEYYFGYATGETDLTAQDFRSRAKSWRYAKYALNFFKQVPFQNLKPLANVSAGWSLGKDGEVYVVYLKNGGSANITLPTGSYTVKWYDPRNGGTLQNGTVTTLSSGTQSIGNPPSNTSSDWAALIQRSTQTGNVLFAVNAGGPTFASSEGITYEADKNFVGGNTYSTSDGIANSTDDALYQSERFGNFSYNIPLGNGTYDITFKFAEIYWTSSNSRVFDVIAEGSEILSNLDVFALSGHDQAYQVTKTVSVSDGTLNLQFVNNTDNAKLSAFSIKTSSASANSLARLSTEEPQNLSEESLEVFPNPSRDYVNIKTPEKFDASKLRVSLTNGNGRVFPSYTVESDRIKISLTGIKAGVYVLDLVTENFSKKGKIIVDNK